MNACYAFLYPVTDGFDLNNFIVLKAFHSTLQSIWPGGCPDAVDGCGIVLLKVWCVSVRFGAVYDHLLH